jgi:hypothetical protein
MTDTGKSTSMTIESSRSVDDFLTRMKNTPVASAAAGRGRLIFALDATASRQPTWDTACHLQAEMFREAGALGTLNIQLAYYRGSDECRTSRWISRSDELLRLMERIDCRAGTTQIGKVLAHAKRETQLLKVAALVFVGDAMEENADVLVQDADELGRLGVPAFMFQEGHDRNVEQVFRQIAKLTKGAYCRFDPGAAKQLAELLRAVAVYAAGGMSALVARGDAGAAKLLLGQMR